MTWGSCAPFGPAKFSIQMSQSRSRYGGWNSAESNAAHLNALQPSSIVLTPFAELPSLPSPATRPDIGLSGATHRLAFGFSVAPRWGEFNRLRSVGLLARTHSAKLPNEFYINSPQHCRRRQFGRSISSCQNRHSAARAAPQPQSSCSQSPSAR